MDVGTWMLLGALVALAVFYVWQWWRRRRRARERTRGTDVGIGFLTNFFDTLGIGSFAPTTAIFKFQRRMPDELIPGTLNAGHALPTIAQALVFIATVLVDLVTLVTTIGAAVAGAWLGAGVVASLPRRAIQVGMGVALISAATLFALANLELIPAGGAARELRGALLAVAVSVNFLLGALMTLGVGLYAPCLIMLSLLGLDPLAAFPIMMGSCAFLMPPAGLRFVARERYSPGAAIGLAIGGVPAVLIAAYVVRSLPLEWLRWLVVLVVLVAAAMMLRSALERERVVASVRERELS